MSNFYRLFVSGFMMLLLLASGCDSEVTPSDGDANPDGDNDVIIDGDIDHDGVLPDGDSEDTDADDDNTSCQESVKLNLSQNELDFGAVNNGTEQAKLLTISSETTHKVISLSILGDNETPEFSIVTDSCTEFVDPPGVCHEINPNQEFTTIEPYEVTLKYTPLDADLTNDNAWLVIETDDKCNPVKRVKLMSRCKGMPNLSVTIDGNAISENSQIEFDEIILGNSPDPITFKLENIGDSTSNAPVWVTFEFDDSFYQVFEWSDCNPTDLATGFLIGSDEKKNCTLRSRDKTETAEYSGKASIFWNSSCINEDGKLEIDVSAKVNECEDGTENCDASNHMLCTEGSWETKSICDDGKVCTLDSCSVSQDDVYGCQFENIHDGTDCDDGNPNTDGTRCLLGECVVWVQCETDDGVCCVDGRVVNEGGICNADDNGCTVGDTCQSGTCMAGPAPDCSGVSDQCNTGVCSSTSGNTYSCIRDNTSHENESCNADSNGCTRNDSCKSGVCVAGSVPDCTSEDDQCNSGVCSSTSNNSYSCRKDPQPKENNSCNADSNGCTVDDKCQAGSCVAGIAPDCTEENDQCNTGICSSTGVNSYNCIKDSQPHENSSCNADDNGCTSNDTCSSGTCIAGLAVDCSLLDDQCNSGRCASSSPSSYRCEKESEAFEGLACDDQNPATGPDSCVDGRCVGQDCTCSGINSCCDGCNPINEGAVCNADSDGCTVDDTCQAGYCIDGAAADCTGESDQCNLGKCHSMGSAGFACLPDSTPLEGQSCDDGNNSTGPDTCTNGHCSGPACVCDAIDGCCDGCQPINNGLSCNADSNGCTVGDKCQAGVCMAGSEPDCSSQDDPCNIGVCSSIGNSNYTCIKDPQPKENSSCDADSNGCTLDDKCQSGSCVAGAGPDCSSESDQCNVGFCSSTGSESYTCVQNSTPLEGQSCDDGNSSTGPDLCTNGVCAGEPCVCNTADSCCDGCQGINQGAACNADSSGCTIGDSCQSGVCTAGVSADCSAEDAECVTGNCVSTGDNSYSCQAMNDNNKPCDLGYGCTDDHCVEGSCEIETVTAGCLIDSTCVAEGVSQDADGCVACNPQNNTTSWSNMDGTVCAETMDDNPCTDNVCQGGTCLVENDNNNTCSDEYDCTTTECSDGSCIQSGTNSGCFIDATCMTENTLKDSSGDDSCKICDSGENWDSWTVLDNVPCDDGNDCTYGDTCQSGACVGSTYDCNGHGDCNSFDDICTCYDSYGGDYCDECSAGNYGTYPACLPDDFCEENMCFPIPPTDRDSCCDDDSYISCPGTAGSSSCGTTPFCGQDAQYPDNNRTYTCYNADGTVQDPCDATADEDEVVTDSLTGLMWQRTHEITIEWQEAMDYCSNLIYAGYSDWRLPNPIELFSIVDFNRFGPSIDMSVFPGVSVYHMDFWTSYELPLPNINRVQTVEFDLGYIEEKSKDGDNASRCVRSYI